MTLQYVKQKDQLPPYTDLECCICIQPIDLDEIVGGVPNCVICINGHRMHNICYNNYGKNICPTCKTDNIKFCKTNSLGYSYAPRTGGKKRKTCKKRKICKKRKTKNRYKYIIERK